MKKLVLVLTVLLFSFSGCSTKPEVIVPKKEVPKVEFYLITPSTKGKLEVNAGSKEVQRMCTPLVIESTGYVWRIAEELEDQAIRSGVLKIIGGNDDTRGEE